MLQLLIEYSKGKGIGPDNTKQNIIKNGFTILRLLLGIDSDSTEIDIPEQFFGFQVVNIDQTKPFKLQDTMAYKLNYYGSPPKLLLEPYGFNVPVNLEINIVSIFNLIDHIRDKYLNHFTEIRLRFLNTNNPLIKLLFDNNKFPILPGDSADKSLNGGTKIEDLQLKESTINSEIKDKINHFVIFLKFLKVKVADLDVEYYKYISCATIFWLTTLRQNSTMEQYLNMVILNKKYFPVLEKAPINDNSTIMISPLKQQGGYRRIKRLRNRTRSRTKRRNNPKRGNSNTSRNSTKRSRTKRRNNPRRSSTKRSRTKRSRNNR